MIDSKERYNQIIDEVYDYYNETHHHEPFILEKEMSLTKEEFVKEITNNYGFGFLFGIQLNKKELTFEQKIQWVMRYTNVEMENLYITEEAYKPTTPTKLITLIYKNETIVIYE